MQISDCKIGFVGFGHMAQILCQSIERAKLIPHSNILFTQRDPHKMTKNEKTFGITSTSLENLVQKSDLLLLCIRPQQILPVLPQLSSLVNETKMVASVVAGIQIAFYRKYLGSKVPFLRTLPNIASSAGEGMTLFSYAPNAGMEFRSLTHLFFSCMGKVLEIPEHLMDVSCGISGSGPGFVFRLIEAAARFGEKNGLSYQEALKMAAQTFLGASRLILEGHLPETLIEQIAPPNGTTEAGFKQMTKSQVDQHFQSVIEAAANRSKELSQDI